MPHRTAWFVGRRKFDELELWFRGGGTSTAIATPGAQRRADVVLRPVQQDESQEQKEEEEGLGLLVSHSTNCEGKPSGGGAWSSGPPFVPCVSFFVVLPPVPSSLIVFRKAPWKSCPFLFFEGGKGYFIRV